MLLRSCWPCTCTKLDVFEVVAGKGCVDAFVALVVINHHIDGVSLLPIYVILVIVVPDIEDTLGLYHERFDKGVRHRVGIRLVGTFVFYCIVESPRSSRLGKEVLGTGGKEQKDR